MKVNVGVVGRFHAFDLAKHLNEKRLLNKIITTYPKYKVKQWGMNDEQIVSEVLLEIMNRYRRKVPLVSNESINRFVKVRHAINCANHLKECDIHIGWSGSSLETLVEAKKQKRITILERGSSHYSYQMRVLEEENKLYGDGSFIPDYSIWQRELLEYQMADFISIPSAFVKKTFVERGFDESKIIVNPYGVNLQEFRQVPKEDSVFRIIFAGSGNLRKGYHYLLEAFHDLDLPNCELWHLGSISDEVKPYLKKYGNDNWMLKGHIPQCELYKYYSQGSVFVLPSIEEGFAMVQFQAMACGLPLVCTTNTGGEDLISENGHEGFVIPTRDIDAIKEKVLFLYENRELASEMGKLAQKKIQSGYSWDDYGRRYAENLAKIFYQ